MSLRDKMNKNPGVVIGIAIGLVVIALVLIVFEMRSGIPADLGAKSYFSDDDGKTYFAADRSNVAPWSHDGKEAVRAHVFKCKDTPYIAYLTKNTPKGKAAIEAQIAGVKDPIVLSGISEEAPGAMIKKPGAPKWSKMTDKIGAADLFVKCPNGAQGDDLVEMFP